MKKLPVVSLRQFSQRVCWTKAELVSALGVSTGITAQHVLDAQWCLFDGEFAKDRVSTFDKVQAFDRVEALLPKKVWDALEDWLIKRRKKNKNNWPHPPFRGELRKIRQLLRDWQTGEL
jgi:hypothetical protein